MFDFLTSPIRVYRRNNFGGMFERGSGTPSAPVFKIRAPGVCVACCRVILPWRGRSSLRPCPRRASAGLHRPLIVLYDDERPGNFSGRNQSQNATNFAGGGGTAAELELRPLPWELVAIREWGRWPKDVESWERGRFFYLLHHRKIWPARNHSRQCRERPWNNRLEVLKLTVAYWADHFLLIEGVRNPLAVKFR